MSNKTNLRNWPTISVFLILFGGTVTMGATIYVDENGPADFSNIQAAIDAAGNGETIVVRDGVYAGDGNRDIDFKGKDITVRSENGPANCIIDCGGSESTQHMGFYFHSAEGPESVVDGFTITNGYHEDAGAILCTYVDIRDPRPSNPTIIRCVITNNRGISAGAIKCNSYCEPLISNCVISGNIGTYTGGISYADESRPVVSTCIVRGNSGQSGGGLRTGGARCHGTISNCVISGNRSTNGGAGICWWSWGGTIEITNCTIVENEDELWSAGICIGGGGGTTGTITNCIIWGNGVQSRALEQIYLWPDGDLPTTAEVTYCDVEGGWLGEGNIDEDPLFVDGDGPDNIIGTEDDNLRLLDGSACLDAGDNSAVTPGLTTDLDGNARIVNATVDMGAYEGPQQGFVLSSRSVKVPEGGTNTFTVLMAKDPLGIVEATVAFESGDPDITIELGSVLIFDSSNYNEPQTVILGAAEDDDYLNGTAFVSVSAAGFSTVVVRANEGDNERIIYVDADATGEDDGSSWADAYRYLQDALAAASSGVQIVVAQGVYKPDQGTYQPPGERSATFQLLNGVAIRGGYAGFGEPDPDARDIELYETILSGDLSGDDIEIKDWQWQPIDDAVRRGNRDENSWTVVTGSGTDGSAVIDGFTITGGHADGPVLGKYPDFDYRLNSGGGMCNQSGSPTVLNCTFHRNTTCGYDSDTHGAGMFNSNSNLTLRNCRFIENVAFGANASSQGGGMYNVNSDPMLTDCVFRGNVVTGFDSDYSGVGMYNFNSSPTLVNCDFIGNGLYYSGSGVMVNTENSCATLTNCTFIANIAENAGAISISDSDTVLIDCTFRDNWARHFAGAILISGYSKPKLINCIFSDNTSTEGGGICTDFRSSAVIKNCIFIRNKADEGGGINNSGAWYNDPNSTIIISGCTFSANSADWHGGGIYSGWNRKTTVSNCLFAANSAAKGGGIYYYGAEQQLTNCTFAGNAAENGNALACDSYQKDNPSSLQAFNCILWDGGNEVFNGDGSELQIKYSDLEGGWPGEGNIDVDPCFAEPGYWDPNGTPEDPNDDFWVDGDHHLKSQAGRYDPDTQGWVKDDVTSPCIDAGDPDSCLGFHEPYPNGLLVNMGAYGGTAEASMSLSPDKCVIPWWAYDYWVEVGEPICWCYKRQCHGDADCKHQGKQKYWVSTNDLDIMIAAWNKTIAEIEDKEVNGVPLICADFDHIPQGKAKYPVSTNDLDILIAYWNIANKPEPDCP